MTAIFLPLRSASRASFDLFATSTLPPSTKIGTLKSTLCIRDERDRRRPAVGVGLAGDATTAIRVAASTGSQSIFSDGRPRSFWIAAATRVHSSTLYPRTTPPRSLNENGAAPSR